MTIDLNGPRETVEELVLVDRCIITRGDDLPGTLNETTGVLTPPAPDVVYSDLPCAVSSSRTGDFMIDHEGEQEILTSRFVGRFPWDTDDLRVGDVMTVTESQDTDLVGREFVLKNVIRVTRDVSRGVVLEARQRGPHTEIR